jgi:hypothetical protein
MQQVYKENDFWTVLMFGFGPFEMLNSYLVYKFDYGYG